MRRLLELLLALVLTPCLTVAESAAQGSRFPDRPVRMLVGFSAGGGTDVAARIIAQRLSETMGQTVVVENRSGASGLIAGEVVARAASDGYTVMMGSQTTFAVAPTLHPKIALDPARDFAGIAMVAASPLVLVVHPSVAVYSVSDVIAMAKTKPVNFGSGGLGTTPHMSGELFSLAAGIKMSHVAYRGEAPAINDLIGGQIPLMFANLSAVIGNVRAGQLRALAVTSAQRAPAAPDIPTVAESGLPGFEAATWFALVAPAGTPLDIRARLNAEVQGALDHSIVRQRFTELGMLPQYSTPEWLEAYIKSEIEKWTQVIRDGGIKPSE